MQRHCCSLCLKSCDISESIEEDARESLAQLLPHFDNRTPSTPLMACIDCSTTLRGYLKFSFNVLETQACVQSFRIDSTLDLTRVYLQNKCVGREVSSKNLVVCRFCLKQTTGSYVALVKDQQTLSLVTIMMRKCFPGLELGAMSGHMMCAPCHEALEASYNFIRSLDVENWLKREDVVEQMEFEEGPEMKPTLFKSERCPKWNGCVDLLLSNGNDFDDVVEVKVEGDLGYQEEHNDTKEVVEITKKDIVGDEDSLCPFEGDTCDIQVEQPESERIIGEASVTPEGTVYKCAECPYDTKLKKYYNRHVLIHKDPSEVTMHKCGACSYETRHKSYYNKHVLIHKKPSEVTMYKCDMCSYQTRFKKHHNRHMLVHKTLSEVFVYNCQVCSYETKHQHALKRHLQIHKKPLEEVREQPVPNEKPSEVLMYKCNECLYETKLKKYYNHHLLIHKKPAEVAMYKCEVCSCKIKRKDNLIRHMLTHKTLPDVTLYKCEVCTYETKFKRYHSRHMLIHKKVSDVTVYKCAECSYETRFKHTYNKHILIHKTPAVVPTYKCTLCSLETMHKSNLKRHILTHEKKVRQEEKS